MHYTKTNTKQDGTRRKQKLANEKLRWTEWLAGQSISQGNRLNPVGSDLSCETLEMGKVFLQKDTDLAGKLRTKKQYKNVLPCAPVCSMSHWSYGVRNSEKCMWLHVLAKEGLIWGSGGALCSSNSCTTCCSHPSEHLEVSRLNSRCPRCSSCWHYCGLCLIFLLPFVVVCGLNQFGISSIERSIRRYS